MARHTGGRWNNHRWDTKDPWQARETESRYGWLKRSAVAVLLFALVYGAYVSDTTVGRSITAGIRYLLTTQTDFGYIGDQLQKYLPKDMDTSVFKRIQNTVSRPADPLMYMSNPVNGKVVSNFGWQTNTALKQDVMRDGIDIEAPLGTPVRAAASGKVKIVTDSAQYGRTVIIEHSYDVNSVYGHLGDVLVKPEDMVSQGQVIARVGQTGIAVSPILYFEVREKGKAVDPLTRIKAENPLTGREVK